MLTTRFQRNSVNVTISRIVTQLFFTRGWHHIPAAGEHEGVLGPSHPQQWPPYTGLLAKGCLNVPVDGGSLSVLHTTVLMIVLILSSHPRIVATKVIWMLITQLYTPEYLIQICQRLGSFYVYQLVASFCVGLVLGEFAHGIRFRALIWEAKRAPWPHVLIKIPAANTYYKYHLCVCFPHWPQGLDSY